MGTVERPSTHRKELELLVAMANPRFAGAVAFLTLGGPIVAYLSGDPTLLFYVHVTLGAFWFGLDFFFKFVVGPALEAAPDDAGGAVNAQLVPKMVVVAEPLSVGVVASGIGLADLFGLWANPSIWLWAALAIAAAMLMIGFVPLHRTTTKMAVEFARPEPDADRLDRLFGRAMQWGLVQTVLMLAIIVAMTGLRGV